MYCVTFAVEYMAPELQTPAGSRSSTNRARYGSQIDQYSFGYSTHGGVVSNLMASLVGCACRIMMSEMINMKPPWPGMATAEEVSLAVSAGGRPSIATDLAASAPTGWIELMQQCWHQDSTVRPSFDEIHNRLKQIQGDNEVRRIEGSSCIITTQTSLLVATHDDPSLSEYYAMPIL